MKNLISTKIAVQVWQSWINTKNPSQFFGVFFVSYIKPKVCPVFGHWYSPGFEFLSDNRSEWPWQNTIIQRSLAWILHTQQVNKNTDLLNGTLSLEQNSATQQLSKNTADGPDVDPWVIMFGPHKDLWSTVVLSHNLLCHMDGFIWLLNSC